MSVQTFKTRENYKQIVLVAMENVQCVETVGVIDGRRMKQLCVYRCAMIVVQYKLN